MTPIDGRREAEMPELNLTELDKLDREATEGVWEIGWERDSDHNPPRRAESVGPLTADHDHWSGWTIGDEADARFTVAARNQLRPLLDMVSQMARALRGAGRDACLRFNDCPHDCCIWRRRVLEDYRRAGGKLL